jgi:hypothetical protein
MIVALAVAIPVVLFPAAFVWYLNIGGMLRAARQNKAARENAAVKTAR